MRFHISLYNPPVATKRPDLCIVSDKFNELSKRFGIGETQRSPFFRHPCHTRQLQWNMVESMWLYSDIKRSYLSAALIQFAGTNLHNLTVHLLHIWPLPGSIPSWGTL